MSGEAVAGSIIGFLRLSADEFDRVIAESEAKLDHLATKDPNIRVKVDSAGAEAKLAAVAASEDKVDKGNVKVAKSGQDAGRGMGALATAIITLGPALVPIAAGTAGLAVGFGAMGAAGVLAVVGIMQEMKAGTTLGKAYSAQVDTLKGNLTTLGHTAAAGVLRPFQMEVSTLQGQMPALNGIIGEFSVITGKTAGVLMSGLVAAFIALEPLARDAGVYVLTLSQRFATLMNGPGVVSFGDYVRSVFPQVMQAVESIVGAALRLVAALAPLGMGTLGILRTFTDLINALPVDVLSTLATTATSVYIGFKSYGMLSVGVTALGTALEFVGVSAETAATGLAVMNIAAGAVAAVLAIAVFAFTANANATRENQQAINDYTDALIRSSGAIDANIREMAFKKLTDSGAIEDAKALGLNLSQVTDAMLGNVPASRAVGAQMAAMVANTQLSSSAALVQSGHIRALSGVLGTSTSQFGSATQAQKDHAAAMATGTTTTDALGAAHQRVTAAQKATAAATAAATQKMQDENDTAGLLKQQLDLLNGKTLSAAGAQNSFDSSLVNMGDHVTATGSKVHFTTKSIVDMSAASVALRGQLNGQVTNLQNVAEANRGLGMSGDKVRDGMIDMRKKIIDNAVAHGVNRAAVTAYIDKLLAIPKKIPPTPLEVETAAALAKIAALKKSLALPQQIWTVGIRVMGMAAAVSAVNAINKRAANVGRAAGGLIGRAGGGAITGPGTPTSDSITGVDASGTPIVRVSRDEFVVNAAAYARNKALVNAINDGTQGFAGGGPVSGSSPAGDGATSADIQALGDRIGAELERQARTIQTMQRQMVGA